VAGKKCAIGAGQRNDDVDKFGGLLIATRLEGSENVASQIREQVV
jgi:hypothetical protein